jgi:hypothetical protein
MFEGTTVHGKHQLTSQWFELISTQMRMPALEGQPEWPHVTVNSERASALFTSNTLPGEILILSVAIEDFDYEARMQAEVVQRTINLERGSKDCSLTHVTFNLKSSNTLTDTGRIQKKISKALAPFM